VTQRISKPIPVDRRDRPWVDAYVTVLIGSFEMPSTEALRQAVTALADRYPESRLTWSLDPTKRFWRRDRKAESIVVEGNWPDNVEVGAQLDAIAHDESLEPPLTLIRYPNHIGLKMSHSVGDGPYFLTVMAATLLTAMMGEIVPWPVQRGGRFPLIAAAFGTFGRHPTLLRAAIRDRPTHRAIERQADTRPWSPSRRTINLTMPRELGDQIIAWGKQFAPTASRFALQVTFILRALSKVGIEVSDNVGVIVDLRRYLGWRLIDGNFVAGVAMRIDAQMSPEQVSSSIRVTKDSGRPLAGQMVASVYGFTAAPTVTSVNMSELPRVTFSDLGKPAIIDGLPYLPDSPVVYSGSVPPEGPLGMTILTGETSRLMGVAATFHDNVIDSALVTEAMKLIEADPVALLSDTWRHTTGFNA
jgi:hypothetical protein